MAQTLTPGYLAELRKGVNTPNVVVEVFLDGGVARFGYHGRNVMPSTAFLCEGTILADGVYCAIGGDDLEPFAIIPALKSVSSLQNRLDTKKGYSTRGQLNFTISGREVFRNLVAGNYLKNRRVVRKDGFVASGFAFTDYAPTFTGIITDWTRKGDEISITVQDDLADASRNLPVENAAKTQFMDYRDTHPVDIMTDLLVSLGIAPANIDTVAFAAERDTWLQGWRFGRVLTEPRPVNEYLNELQAETNSFIVHDGGKITFKVFSPPAPGSPVEEWTDSMHIMDGSLSVKSGYRDGFYNRVAVYFDYDESGGDRPDSFESMVLAVDAASQDQSQWNEASTRTVKSKWIRSRTFTQQGTLTGVKVYHVSTANGFGAGSLFYNSAANTLSWSAPGGNGGEPVTLSKDGRYQVFDADRLKYVRVIVERSSLPAVDAMDAVSIKSVNGELMATNLAYKLLCRYRDPVATISFDIDMNNVSSGTSFIKPTDIKDITTDEACTKGSGAWTRNRVMLTSVRPDFSTHKVSIEAIETRMSKRYGFISPAGLPDYQGTPDEQKGYAFVGSAANITGSSDGYYIW